MGNPYVGNAGEFLIGTLFGLYILLVMLRFLLQTVRADFYNPVSQFVVKATNPPLRPLRRLIPGVGGVDVAAIVLMLALEALKLLLILGLRGASVGAAGLLVLAAAGLLGLAIDVFFFAILVQVILSWVNPGAYNPVTNLLHTLNEPLLGPARRLLPPMGGLDLSPLVVVVVLKLAEYLLVHPLRDFGASLL